MTFGPIEFTVSPLVSGPKIVFDIFGLPVSSTVITTWIIMFLFFVFFKFMTSKLEIIPSKRQVIIETLYELLEGMIGEILGTWKKKYFLYFSTLFLFILISNIIAFFPVPWMSIKDGSMQIYALFRTPTADLNTTVCLAMFSTLLFIGVGIQNNSLFGYLKGFLSPTPLLLPLNIVGEIAKPLNISIRLFGNMFAGMVIIGLIYYAVPYFVPVPLHLYFDLFSGLVQSFVFVNLSMVYLQGSIGDKEYVEEKNKK